MDELAKVIGPACTSDLVRATASDYEEPLRRAFTALMSAPKGVVGEALQSLEAKVKAKIAKVGKVV